MFSETKFWKFFNAGEGCSTYKEAAMWGYEQGVADKNPGLKAENKTLRDALTNLLFYADQFPEPPIGAEPKEIAREALKGGGERNV